MWIIFNKSFIEGIYPDTFKLAKGIPLHKDGENDDDDNYRPISLLTVISKILEKLMFKQLNKFIQDTNQYYLKQFGFHLNHCTTHAIAELVGEILQDSIKTCILLHYLSTLERHLIVWIIIYC